MKVAFYAPMKPISHPNPSGDREIARGLHSYLSKQAEVFVLSEFRSRNFFLSPGAILNWFRNLWRAYLLARKERPDLFFTYHTYYKAPDAIGFLLARWFGKPYIIFEGIYGRASARRGWNWIGYCFNRAALSTATRIYCDKTKDFESMRVQFPGKTFYLPPSLDLSRFSRGPGNDIPVIATVAMLRPDRKTEGVKFLLRVLGKLAREGLDFYWWHAGGGVCLEEVRGLAKENLSEKAELLGEIQNVPDFLAGADIFAFPGIDEAFGLVFAEAQAAGLPVVAFRGDGSTDAVLEGETGFLTPSFDEEAYANALRRLILDRGLRREMGAKAQAHTIRYDREKNYAQLLK